ncbi:hypothetical protein EII34_04190 [Arachnia propionica]|uniref:Uncharacterized protein n=1 Tax=Arachnia propionica TaxID=1750 RepID=A0A3P1TAF9_9ACTN|nr:hypothetical protein [Arachnia propionica]RRD06320.1 hypothetical protein EII34_04190 [Arachnia propionica]
MNNLWLALTGAWQVLLAGLLLGAGLPAIFALGIRVLSVGAAGTPDDPQPTWLGRSLAGICFAVVGLGILAGIGTIVAHGFGAQLTFDGIIPVFVRR